MPFIVCGPLGQILRTGSAPGHMILAQARDGEFAFAGTADQLANNVNLTTGELSLKVKMEPVVTGTVLSNLPNPTRVMTEGHEFTVTDGALDLQYDAPGTFDVTLQSPIHLDTTIQVTKS